MKHKQTGFTLVEMAIVLVIIGLLLAAILKGQELINAGKVKALGNDVRNIPAFINGYQDRYRAMPGDDAAVVAHLANLAVATVATTPAAATIGNGALNGAWDSITNTDETVLVWQHLRIAGFMPGTTVPAVAAGNNYLPTNAFGGRIGVTSDLPAINDASFTGTFFVCTANIPDNVARALDQTLDDGVGTTGSVRAIATAAAPAARGASVAYAAGTTYTVCLAQ
jgi:prepilin-type N-terminal cleavage/methylation domain-containing protein